MTVAHFRFVQLLIHYPTQLRFSQPIFLYIADFHIRWCYETLVIILPRRRNVLAHQFDIFS